MHNAVLDALGLLNAPHKELMSASAADLCHSASCTDTCRRTIDALVAFIAQLIGNSATTCGGEVEHQCMKVKAWNQRGWAA